LLEAVFVGIKIQIRGNLLLEELEGNLGNNSFQLPDWTFVEFADVFMTFCWCLEFWTKVCFKNGFEKRNPRS